MQKEVHYNATLYLALCAGLPREVAVEIAWADQFTDELLNRELNAMRIFNESWWDTFCGEVAIPFHFLPGKSIKKPWNCTARSANAIRLMKLAIESGNLSHMRVGMALHTFQDACSHTSFSGRDENSNAKYWWWNMVPSIGHMHFGCDPDMIEKRWYDPRRKRNIDNRIMARNCLYDTLLWLRRYAIQQYHRKRLSKKGYFKLCRARISMPEFVGIENYDARKRFVQELTQRDFDVPDWTLRFSQCNAKQEKHWQADFKFAAGQHLIEAQKLFPI